MAEHENTITCLCGWHTEDFGGYVETIIDPVDDCPEHGPLMDEHTAPVEPQPWPAADLAELVPF